MRRTGVDPGKPLFLTSYIEQGHIEEAQQLAKVGQLNGTSVLSYSGFLTVNKTYNSNMFFWYFPSVTMHSKDPVLVWLQGGPGGSSLFGLFVENGPFYVDMHLHLLPRKFSWTNKYHVIYIDNPVGTGFSFTDDDAGYARNEEDVADNLYEFLEQFFTLFPSLLEHPLYLTGESYAGKYVPAIAHRIHRTPFPKKIFLRGIAVGDGFTDPPTMIQAYADFMFQTALLDENQRDYFRNVTNQAVQYIEQQEWVKAFQLFDLLLDSDLSGVPSFFTNCTGTVDYYNYLNTVSPKDFDYYSQLLSQPEVRLAIHVGDLPYHSGETVEKFLMSDVMQSAKLYLSDIMNYYKVLLYSGQLDVIVAVPLTEAMLQSLEWKYQDEYKRAKRTVWKIHNEDVDVAGYVRHVHDFYQVVVRGGGHILPYDQPERSWDMIDRFISDRPFQ